MHDNVARVIHLDLSGKCGFEQNERWYDPILNCVLEIDNYKIPWDSSVKLRLGGLTLRSLRRKAKGVKQFGQFLGVVG